MKVSFLSFFSFFFPLVNEKGGLKENKEVKGAGVGRGGLGWVGDGVAIKSMGARQQSRLEANLRYAPRRSKPRGRASTRFRALERVVTSVGDGLVARIDGRKKVVEVEVEVEAEVDDEQKAMWGVRGGGGSGERGGEGGGEKSEEHGKVKSK